MCFISSTSNTGDGAGRAQRQGSEVTVCVKRKGSQCSQGAQRAEERSAMIYDLSVPTLALGPEQLEAVRRSSVTSDG